MLFLKLWLLTCESVRVSSRVSVVMLCDATEHESSMS
jgi:hypothetical protein